MVLHSAPKDFPLKTSRKRTTPEIAARIAPTKTRISKRAVPPRRFSFLWECQLNDEHSGAFFGSTSAKYCKTRAIVYRYDLSLYSAEIIAHEGSHSTDIARSGCHVVSGAWGTQLNERISVQGMVCLGGPTDAELKSSLRARSEGRMSLVDTSARRTLRREILTWSARTKCGLRFILRKVKIAMAMVERQNCRIPLSRLGK